MWSARVTSTVISGASVRGGGISDQGSGRGWRGVHDDDGRLRSSRNRATKTDYKQTHSQPSKPVSFVANSLGSGTLLAVYGSLFRRAPPSSSKWNIITEKLASVSVCTIFVWHNRLLSHVHVSRMLLVFWLIIRQSDKTATCSHFLWVEAAVRYFE